VMFHHDPMHSDDELERILARATDLWQGTGNPVLAYEGMELDLT